MLNLAVPRKYFHSGNVEILLMQSKPSSDNIERISYASHYGSHNRQAWMGREGELPCLGFIYVSGISNDVLVKAFDDKIAEKWKQEALNTQGQDVSQKMMDWVIDELRYKAKIFKETGTVCSLSTLFPLSRHSIDCDTFALVPPLMSRGLPATISAKKC
jgi:hypothetical protein